MGPSGLGLEEKEEEPDIKTWRFGTDFDALLQSHEELGVSLECAC